MGEKLTQRENKRVKNLCLMIIRHQNIEVVKYKPQLVVKWSSLQTEQHSHDQPVPNDEEEEATIQ